MKPFLVCCLLIGLAAAGCVSKSTANAQARAAYLAGQRDAMSQALKGPSVGIIGNVKNAVIPWTPELTLAKALIAAEYRGATDPGEIIVSRPGQPALHVRAQQLLQGQDMPLQAGDQIEIRP